MPATHASVSAKGGAGAQAALHLVLDGLVLQLGPELPEAEGQLHISNVTLRELSIEGEIYIMHG